MEYDGPDRRSSPDTVMLLQEIQKVAIVAAQTSTDVKLLREDFADVKTKMATCEDVEAVDYKITAHIENHNDLEERGRFNITTLVAVIAGGGGLIAGIAAFLSIPKGHP